MKKSFTHIFILILTVGMALPLTLTGCKSDNNNEAESAFQRCVTLYEQGHYAEALDSIKAIRQKYPQATEIRRQALSLWQKASLKMTQLDIATTDSALQQAERDWQAATTIALRNNLKARYDSLKIRYDALCGTVRVIHKRMEE